MKKTVAIITMITIVAKIVGFGREMALSFVYGASEISDAYLIANTIPNVIFGAVSSGLIAAFIPMYSKIREESGEIKADRFTNNLVNLLVIKCTMIVLIGIVFTNQIVKIFASGFESELLNLTADFTRISLLAIYFMGLASIFTGYLQLKGNHVVPALISLSFNFGLISSIFLSSKFNIYMLAIGIPIAAGLKFAIMIPSVYRMGFRYKLFMSFRDKDLLKMAYITAPVILGLSVNQLNVLVDRTLASQITTGGISALNYASRLNGFVHGIFVLPAITVLYPSISKLVAENKMERLKKTLSESITGINLLVTPAIIGSIIFATPIVNLLFGRGSFNEEATVMTSSALVYYSLGMVSVGLRELLSRVFYSMQDTKTPMINATIGMLLNIALNFWLTRFMGLDGLAMATSISATVTLVLMFMSLRSKIGAFGITNVFKSFLKILISSLIMGLVAMLSFSFFSTIISNYNVVLLTAIATGTMTYFVVVYFMRIEDVDATIRAIRKKLNIYPIFR
ncbi:MAG: murein biosynthesis integral membrane protein MurJ [Clostridiales bacterium]|nr:murein biosynthesis integral membrane protein MurJ [Clostridiales bacterium]